jgi:acyl carrier protein
MGNRIKTHIDMTVKNQLKRMIVEELKLEDITPEEIQDEEPLFNEGLGLDSLDAVEIVLLIDKHFNVQIRDMKEGRKVMRTINSLSLYIEDKMAKTQSAVL